MSIKEMLEKIKPFYNLVVILLLTSIFFILGRLSVTESQKTPINIVYSSPNLAATAIIASTTASLDKDKVLNSNINTGDVIQTDGPVIGSKSGKKYYFPWCGTVKRIKLENQVKFNSIKEAKNAGFTAGGNCKGLN